MSKKLAIRGHSTRGKEVIELLEMMGGKNIHKLEGNTICVYYIIEGFEREIRIGDYMFDDEDICFFTLEEFLEKYPFKVGDFVRIPEYESEVRIFKMKWCPLSEHIEYLVCPNDEDEWFTADELLEDNDNPNETRDCKKCGLHFGSVRCFDNDYPHNTPKNKDNVSTISKYETIGQGTYAIKIADGYKFDSVDENGNIIVKSIKPKYPTTFEECLNILYCKSILRTIIGHKAELLLNLEKLLICRDAYWKIAGEQMGLDKPWEPDWKNGEQKKYCIYYSGGDIQKGTWCLHNSILVFPTEEMRDVFYENFKDLIEQCKELL